jgi:hypothetical protein
MNKTIQELRHINNVTTSEVELANGKHFAYSVGDNGNYIERDGVEYSEAYDPMEYWQERVYVETDKPIEESDDMNEEI